MRSRALWRGIAATCLAAGCAAPPEAEPGRRPRAAGGTFEPIVLPDSIVGRVVDDARQPIPGATVTLFLSWTKAEIRHFSAPDGFGGMIPIEERMQPLAVRVTAADGRYAFHGLEAGQYTLRVIAPGCAFTEREVLVGVERGLYAAGPAQQEVAASAARFEPLSLAVVPERLLSGRVVEEDGSPIQGATVQVFHETESLTMAIHLRLCLDWEAVRLMAQAIDSRTTDADGRFAFHGIEDGPYTLRVVAPGHAFAEREVYVSAVGGS